MSMMWMGTLVAVGLTLLVIIAYGAHRMEMAKIDRLRKAGLHRDRYRDLLFILDIVPSAALKGDLPLLLTRSMVMHLQKAIELDGRSPELHKNLKGAREMYEMVARGEKLPSRDLGGSIGERLKDVQKAIKLLKEFILQQHRGGFLNKAQGMEYIKSLHEINLTAVVDGLISQGKHNHAEGNKTLALRYYKYALKELTKSKAADKLEPQKQFIIHQIEQLKADQKAISEATSEINKKLAEKITRKKDDEDGFEMQQIN